MLSEKEANSAIRLDISYAKVASWLSAIPDEHWLDQIEGDWTVKDLVGHLAAWSNLLLDQIEALAQGNPEEIKEINIDSWNAAQIALRSSWSTAAIRGEWERCVPTRSILLAQIAPESFFQCWRAAGQGTDHDKRFVGFMACTSAAA